MPKSIASVGTALAIVVTVGTAAVAQAPRITNGPIASRPGAPLAETFRDALNAHADIAWIGYSVPAVAGERTMCCFDGGSTFVSGNNVSACCGRCRLEPSPERSSSSPPPVPSSPGGPVELESGNSMLVLFRVVNRQVERVRVFSDDCSLDAGGRPVVWLTGVRPVESLALLEGLVATRAEGDRRDRIADAAISAIALHRDATATASLERLLATSQPADVRGKVTFWLGTARGTRGLDLLQRVLKDDPSAEVRKKAVFGISQSPEPRAVDVLIDNARSHTDASVRAESVFWLAQKAGRKAAGAIAERVEQDPDTEVKKKAVFALSQLPRDEGVPLLVQVARTHSSPAVRKQAMFWLGQSKDPRAIDFFAEILK